MGQARIIPARAGFTGRRPRGRPGAWDHPRSRGGYWEAITGTLAPAGIIPARAGFTEPERRRNALALGSSPLARGLHVLRPATVVAEGIIPARAGFTASRARAGSRLQDHPRSRGVYHDPVGALLGGGGSSPLARGLLATSIVRPAKAWIIPARAGFTLWGRVAAVDLPDHPRSRGVYRTLLASSVRRQGSSPLARGLHAVHLLPDSVTGIIPARAGFTSTPASRAEHPEDHPRSRGVYCGGWP